MNKKKFNKLIFFFTLIIIPISLRLIPHPPNFAPIGALALFSGTHLDKKSRFLLPFVIMIVSDFFLKFHATIPFVYFSFFLTILLGIILKNKTTVLRLSGAGILTSIVFFLITNFGVWAVTDMYSKNFTGLIHAYTLAIPFFRNTILSDLTYTYTFFYGYQIVKDIALFFPPSKLKSTV